jgi:hypothetical protein
LSLSDLLRESCASARHLSPSAKRERKCSAAAAAAGGDDDDDGGGGGDRGWWWWWEDMLEGVCVCVCVEVKNTLMKGDEVEAAIQEAAGVCVLMVLA